MRSSLAHCFMSTEPQIRDQADFRNRDGDIAAASPLRATLATLCLRGAPGARWAPRLTRGSAAFFVLADHNGPVTQEEFMAKGQTRGNREIRKPKKPVEKQVDPSPVMLGKGVPATAAQKSKKK